MLARLLSKDLNEQHALRIGELSFQSLEKLKPGLWPLWPGYFGIAQKWVATGATIPVFSWGYKHLALFVKLH